MIIKEWGRRCVYRSAKPSTTPPCPGCTQAPSADRTAAHEAGGAGCTWLHVDFEQHLTRFHVDTCGFRTTAAGMLHLLGGDLLAARVEPGLTALGRARRRPPPLVLFP